MQKPKNIKAGNKKNNHSRRGTVSTNCSIGNRLFDVSIRKCSYKATAIKSLRQHPDLSRNLFTDPESSKAQEAQEVILLEMITATGKEFLDDLDVRGQKDPAIITYDGYIIGKQQDCPPEKYK